MYDKDGRNWWYYKGNSDPAVYTDTSNDSLLKVLNAHGIYKPNQLEWYTKFNRFGFLDVYNCMTTSKEYLFFTKPDLNIFANSSGSRLNPDLERYPIWCDAYDRYHNVLRNLQLSVDPDLPFIALFSNSVASTLDLPGITSAEVETNENIYGTHMTYRRSSLTTDEHHDFSLEFIDSKYLEVYAWFRLYDEYAKLKDLGMVEPIDDTYIVNRILYDQMAVYKFIVGEDGETLLYWAKLWGVFPKNVPREAFSDLSTATNGLRLTINFHGIFVDDFDPLILGEFNDLTLHGGKYPSTNRILPIYDFSIGAVSGEWAGCPFVVRDSTRTSNNAIYRLKWRRA